MSISLEELRKELSFKTSRSSGAGGQNVNKVETRVSLMWDMAASTLFSPSEKEKIQKLLSSKVNADGFIQLDVSQTRSQLGNKELAIDKLLVLVGQALKPVKKRVRTKIPRSKVLERMDRKKRHSTKKSDRRWRMD